MDINQILNLLERPVPRYTSYPTANHFKATTKTNLHEKQLESVEGEVSLYFHIPFCRSLCTYCGCFTRIPSDYEKVLSYVDSLVNEIKLVAQKAAKRIRIKHIHFGGGTPTYLAKDDLTKIFSAITQYFSLDSKVEIAVEIDPRTVEHDIIKHLKDFGVNRISLGVQDFNDDVQRVINRIQPFKIISKSVEIIRSLGIDAINFDLMYGLPLQTIEKIQNNIKLALSLEPNRIAYFGYAHMPQMYSHQKPLELHHLPNVKERYEQFIFGRDMLVSKGYCHFGLDHFAQKDDPLTMAYADRSLKRNFQGYTTDIAPTLIGFGVSAISSFRDGFFQNSLKILDYKNKITKGQLSTSKEFILSKDDIIRQSIISQLMCFGKVNLKEVCPNHWEQIYITAKQNLHIFENLTFIQIFDDHTIQITPSGMPLMRLIASCFDAHTTFRWTDESLMTAQKQHSRT
ncbi:MAG: oxygen-independent coproporphyrinogen III oxidase [Alphaproteobacteria bacterium]|nr:oxygen-independent coproporphyrinogen III oxidase [Alphaproteobacteria bacterium]